MGSMEKQMSTETKCPFHQAGTVAGATNRDWWPNQLRVELLQQHSSKSNPMGQDFNYAQEFASLDYAGTSTRRWPLASQVVRLLTSVGAQSTCCCISMTRR